MQAKIIKHSQNWHVSGVQDMSKEQLDSVLDKITHELGFTPDLKIDIATKFGNFSCPGYDLDNSSVRKNLYMEVKNNE